MPPLPTTTPTKAQPLWRYDVDGTVLWREAFSEKDPAPGKLRPRWRGDPSDQKVKNMRAGLRQLAR